MRPAESELNADIVTEFYEALLDLETCEKWRIDALTEIAAQQASEGFLWETVYALEQRLQTAKPAHKLPAWYLLDALAKAAGAPARKALEEALPDLIVKHMDFEHPTLNEKYTELITVWSDTKLFPATLFTRVEELLLAATRKAIPPPPPAKPPATTAPPPLPPTLPLRPSPPTVVAPAGPAAPPTATPPVTLPLLATGWPLLPLGLWPGAGPLAPLDWAAQRRQRTALLRDALHSGPRLVCDQCALRFRDPQALARHKDHHIAQHFQKAALSRRWLLSAAEWVVTTTVDEDSAVAPLADILEQRPTSTRPAKRPRVEAAVSTAADVVLRMTDSLDHHCAACREPLRKYLTGSGEWALEDSCLVRPGDVPVVCHKGCLVFVGAADRTPV